jgi:hypothetical protein
MRALTRGIGGGGVVERFGGVWGDLPRGPLKCRLPLRLPPPPKKMRVRINEIAFHIATIFETVSAWCKHDVFLICADVCYSTGSC